MKYCIALVVLAGCLDASGPLASTADDLSSENGLSLNGLSLNGLSLNGLSLNGTSLNGLSLNGLDLGLATTKFTTWFQADPAGSALQLGYLAKCAKPAGQNLTWTDPAMHTSYTWPGELGLAPLWTNRAMTVAEQQVMSACMLAHANKFGVHIPIAIEGLAANGTVIARAANELTVYSIREAAFFGNTATGEGAFVCLDHAPLPTAKSTARACAFDSIGTGTDAVCPPIVFAGPCSKICTADTTKTYYTSCTFNGRTYVPLATRLQPSSIYVCGDGVCQFTEHCGTGKTYDSCKADCGVCP
ncbi:MAG: hypothetical protein ABI467_06630 [Kofleriaceae bacterium]